MQGFKLLLLALLLMGYDPGITPAKGQQPGRGDGEALVALMAKHVELIVENAVANKVNQQDLILSCSGSNCSRGECLPLADDLDTYNCTYSPDKLAGCTDVPSDPQACHNVRITLLEGYVRKPFNTSTVPCEIRKSICVQRALDPTFQTATKELADAYPNVYFHMFFGSVAGDFRYFPGREAVIQCADVPYDPRHRPWYIQAINVAKSMVVLLDNGEWMKQPASELDKTSAFNATKHITELLLNSSAVEGDLMSVIFFNSVASSDQAPLRLNASARDSLTPLLAKVRGAPGPVDGASNLTAGLELARAIQNASDTPRIVVVFTYISFDPSLFQQAIDDTLAVGTKLFIYAVGGDSTTRNASCYHFEALGSAPLQSLNPLFALKSFFSFLARSRKEAFNGTNHLHWASVYDSSTRIGLNQVITVSVPALDVNGQLVGVAGIDLPIHALQDVDLNRQVSAAWHKRQIPIPSNVSGADICQDSWQDAADTQRCETVAAAVCAPTSALTNFQLLCCEGCGGTSVADNTSICGAGGQQCSEPSPPPSQGTQQTQQTPQSGCTEDCGSKPPVKIIVPVVVSVVVLVAGALAWYFHKKYFSEIPLPEPPQSVPSSAYMSSPDKL